MKALLVNPYIHDVSAYDFWLKPTGLLYISKALKMANVEIRLLDLLDRTIAGNNLRDGPYGTGKFHSVVIKSLMDEYGIPRYLKRYGAPFESAKKKMMNFSPDVVLVTSMMTYWYSGVVETIEMLRRIFKAPIILGGNYATLLPTHAKNVTGADIVVSGDGIPAIYEALSEVTNLKIDAALGKDWFERITPDYDEYANLKAAVVHTTFGCPYRCTYCVAWKKGFRSRSVDSVVDEIHALKNRGVKNVAFYDDAILVDKKRFKKILRHLPRGVNFHLPNGIHAALLDEETAILMKEKRFKTIKIGYETGDPYLQRRTGGKVSNEAFYRAVKILKDTGFTGKEVGVYLIVGLPGQSFESAFEDIKRVIETGMKPYINEYTLIPGSIDWTVAIENGMIDENVDPMLLNNSLIHYWWKASMGIEKIQALKNALHAYTTHRLNKDELLKMKPSEIIDAFSRKKVKKS